jgi:two-component system NtrC family sensor kinase
LEIGIFDYLTSPVESSTLLLSVKRSLVRQKSWQEWNQLVRVLACLEDGVILVDLDGHLLTMNQSARNIFSIGEDQIEGKSVSEVFRHPDLLDIFKPQNVLPRLSEISLEDGRVFSAQASLIPDIGIAVVIQEITHLKELDRIKTDFVNTVSHDLRSPLTAIYGFVSLIDRVGSINEQQADFIRHIQSSVQHITSLINDLMDLGRVEANYDIQMEDVNLKDIINQSIENLDYQVDEKMQEMELSIPDDVPGILGNPLHLQRMVSNLLENAIKFTPPLGKISIRLRAEASQLILEVTDNGPGVPLADQPHIFDKFYRGSNLSQNTPGTGLGLSIVKSVVEKHHGRIWLESLPTGTTFTVILPLK